MADWKSQCVKIWSDNWLPTFVTSCPKPTTNVVGPIPTMVASLIDYTSLSQRLNEIEHFVSQDDACLIKFILLYGHLEEEKRLWPWTKDGNYSIKSGYNWTKSHSFSSSRVSKHSSHQIDNKDWKLIWNIRAVPKVNNFLWRAITNAIPTKLSFFHRKVASNPLCPFCKKFEESIEHIMLLCPWVMCVWFGSLLNYKPNPQLVTTLDSWFLGMVQSLSLLKPCLSNFLSLIAIIVWEIWKERCHALFNGLDPSPARVLQKSSSLFGEIYSCTVTRPPCKRRCNSPTWSLLTISHISH